MKFTAICVLSAILASVSAFPNTKEFQFHDALKAAMDPEKVDSIQKHFQNVYRNKYDIENTAEMTEMECIQRHLDNISRINAISNDEILECTRAYVNGTSILDKAALEAKLSYDKKVYKVAQSLTRCEGEQNAELGLECQTRLKLFSEDINQTSSDAQKSLDSLLNKKATIKMEKNWCISDSVNAANKQINDQHEQISRC